MATISATYKRTFKVRDYEAETVELHVSDDVEEVDGKGRGQTGRAEWLASAARELHLSLADVGDRVVVERMASAPQRPARPSSTVVVDTTKDPWS